MSRRYTDEEKAHAIQRLTENFYNISVTSLQIGIPIRTLHAWRREHLLQQNAAARMGFAAAHQHFSGENPLLPHKIFVRQQQQQQQAAPQPAPTNGIHKVPIWQQIFEQPDFPAERDPAAVDDLDPIGKEYTHIRQRLMSHVEHLIDTLNDDPHTSHLRIIALTRLLDRVIRLESLVRRETPERNIVEIRYTNSLGEISHRPPWLNTESPEPYQGHPHSDDDPYPATGDDESRRQLKDHTHAVSSAIGFE